MDKPEQDNLELSAVLEQVSNLLNMTHLKQAAELAYAGNLAEAEGNLIRILKSSPNHDAYDLLARVKIQQGDLIQAEILWKQALELKPDCTDCQKAISKIHELQNREINRYSIISQNWSRAVGVIGLAALIIFLLIMIYDLTNKVRVSNYQIGSLSTAILDVNTQPATSIPQDNSLLVQTINDQNSLISVLSTRLAEPTLSVVKATETDIPDFYLPLAINGVKIAQRGNSVELIFEEGLFQYETLLTSNAKEILLNLGNQLKPYTSEIRLEVVGFIDISEVGREDLKLSRASTVVTYLGKAIPLPESIFSIKQPGDTVAPYDNSTLDGRKNNRTVVIRIFPVNQ